MPLPPPRPSRSLPPARAWLAWVTMACVAAVLLGLASWLGAGRPDTWWQRAGPEAGLGLLAIGLVATARLLRMQRRSR